MSPKALAASDLLKWASFSALSIIARSTDLRSPGALAAAAPDGAEASDEAVWNSRRTRWRTKRKVFGRDQAAVAQDGGALEDVVAARGRCPASGSRAALAAPRARCPPAAARATVRSPATNASLNGSTSSRRSRSGGR